MTAEEKLNNYINSLPEHYRAANLVFAHYAAFPSVFSPDLLYQFWFYLQGYKQNDKIENLPMVVVSDLLQSGLCQEIAYELFELDEEVVRYIKSDDKKHLLSAYQVELLHDEKDCASLTFEYAERYYKYSNKQNLYDLYYWKSSFKLNPAAASKEIKDILKNKNETKINNKNARIFLQIADYQAQSQNSNDGDINKLPTFSFTQKGTDSIDIEDDVVVREIAKIIGLKGNEGKANKFMTKFPSISSSKYFFEKDDLISIKKAFETSRRAAIIGEAAIGKTILACSYMRRYEDDYVRIIYLTAVNIHIKEILSILHQFEVDIEDINTLKQILQSKNFNSKKINNVLNNIITKINNLDGRKLLVIDEVELISILPSLFNYFDKLENFHFLIVGRSIPNDLPWHFNQIDLSKILIENPQDIFYQQYLDYLLFNPNSEKKKHIEDYLFNNKQFIDICFNNSEFKEILSLNQINIFPLKIQKIDITVLGNNTITFSSICTLETETELISSILLLNCCFDLVKIQDKWRFLNPAVVKIPANEACKILFPSITKIKSDKPELIKYLEKDLGKTAKQAKTTKELDENLLKDDFLYYVNEKGEITHMLLWNLSYPNIRHLTFFTDLVKLEINKSTGLDLGYINNLNNLEELCLCENDITDIHFVRKLTKLKELSLCDNNIYDINDLKNLIQLEDLNIFANQISDISPLRNLSNLRILDISGNNISDMEMLKKLYNLEDLDIAVNEITNVSFIQNLIKLKKLDLSGNEISDISAISSLYNLEQLDLRHCAISELSEEVLSYFSNQENLKELVLNGNYIRGVPHGILEAENALEGLRAFMHNSKAISNLGKQLSFGLRQAKHETSIIAPNLRVTGFYILNEAGEVTHLNLLGLELKDLSFLKDFTQLEVLNLNGNSLNDIEDLKQLQFLKKLDLGNNQIQDIGPLSNLSNLEELYLGNNQVKELFPLLNLRTIKKLELQKNSIEEIYYFLGKEAPRVLNYFHDWPNLSELQLSDNPIAVMNTFVFNQKNCLEDFKLYEQSAQGNIEFLIYNIDYNIDYTLSVLARVFKRKLPKKDDIKTFILDNKNAILKYTNDYTNEKLEYNNGIQIKLISEEKPLIVTPVFVKREDQITKYSIEVEYKTNPIEIIFYETPNVFASNKIDILPETLLFIIDNSEENLTQQFQAFLDNQYKEVILDNYQDYLDLFCNSPVSDDVKKKTIKSLIENGQFLNHAIQNLLEEELKPIIIQDFIFKETLEVLGIHDIGYGEKSHEIVVYGNNNAVLQVNIDYRDINNVRIYTLPFKFIAHLKKGKEWFMYSCSFSINSSNYNTGIVTRYFDEKGFGFINASTMSSKNEGIFFHIKQCVDRNYMPTVGDKVVYDAVPGRAEGRVQANNVVFIDSQIDFKTYQEALEYLVNNPQTNKKNEIIATLSEEFDYYKEEIEEKTLQKIYDLNALNIKHIDVSLDIINNVECYDGIIQLVGEATVDVEYSPSESNIDNIEDYPSVFDLNFTINFVQEQQLNLLDKPRNWVVQEASCHLEKKSNDIEDYSLDDTDFKTPQKTLAFFIKNPNTTRKDEIIEAIKDDNYFLANILEQILHDELHNEITLGNHEIDETIVEDITNLEYIVSDDEIAIAGSGTTSVFVRFDDIKIHDNFSFTFDIRIGQDTKKQWVLADNEESEVTVFKQEDENTPSDELYKNEEIILDKASIKRLIDQYRIKEAIDALSKVLPMHEQNNILSLAGHWSSLDHLSNIGFLDSEDDIARNKVIHELLSLCDNI